MAPAGLVVVGDKGWKHHLPPGPPETPLLPPVDYYTTLPGLYRAASYTFNVTSLLLPGGLTQRHFDVWRAGGFLLPTVRTDSTFFRPNWSTRLLWTLSARRRNVYPVWSVGPEPAANFRMHGKKFLMNPTLTDIVSDL